MITKLLQVLYPDRCPFCNEVIDFGKDFCNSCELPLVSKETDPREIAAHNEFYEAAVSVFYYEGNVQETILKYKYYTEDNKFEQIGQIFAKYLKTAIEQDTNIKYDYITYVPMYKQDLKERKFNQAEHLACCLGKLLKLPVLDTLEKTRKTQMQHNLNAKDRAQNIKGAIGAKETRGLTGKNILLIDDIITTGATLNECAKMLREKNVNRVDVATLATTKLTRG